MSIMKGMVAGFVATLVLSILLVLVSVAGLAPGLDVIQAFARMGSALFGMPTGPRMPIGPASGWAIHFAIGTFLWGGLFALLYPGLPGGAVLRGVVFALAVWLILMLVLMPGAGAGLFGLDLGLAAPVVTFVLHLVFGAVLGATYRGMIPRRPALI